MTPNRVTNFTPFFMVTRQRSSYPLNCSMGPPWFGPLNQTRLKKPERMPLTYSKSQETSPSQGRLDTNKHSDSTTHAGSIPGLSRWAI
jgi:hypothetical protein